jgi:hypothetical protein
MPTRTSCMKLGVGFGRGRVMRPMMRHAPAGVMPDLHPLPNGASPAPGWMSDTPRAAALGEFLPRLGRRAQDVGARWSERIRAVVAGGVYEPFPALGGGG